MDLLNTYLDYNKTNIKELNKIGFNINNNIKDIDFIIIKKPPTEPEKGFYGNVTYSSLKPNSLFKKVFFNTNTSSFMFDYSTKYKAPNFFIGLAMSELSEEEYNTTSENIKKLVNNIKKIHPNISIFCELLEIKKEDYLSPLDSCKKDFALIDNCTDLIFYYPNKSHTSLILETGYAIAKNKIISIFCNDKNNLPYMLKEIDLYNDKNHISENCSFKLIEEFIFNKIIN